MEVFGNGQSIISIDLLSEDEDIQVDTDSDFMRFWDPTHRLQVFSDSSHWNGVSGINYMFPGAIHEVSLFQHVLDEEIAQTLYRVGVEKRKDPFHSFFQDPNNPFAALEYDSDEDEDSDKKKEKAGKKSKRKRKSKNSDSEDFEANSDEESDEVRTSGQRTCAAIFSRQNTKVQRLDSII